MIAARGRGPHPRWSSTLAALIVCAALLYLTRTYTFYFDEWTFITSAPDWTLRSYFEPHNEHPVMLLRLVYSLLLETAGLRTYLPYMAALLLAHAANVLLLFELVRRRAGDVAAMAAALVMLVLGAGWEDLLWAFQVGWLSSMALGLGAVLALERRPALAAALLAVALAFAGTGVAFAVAMAVQLLV